MSRIFPLNSQLSPRPYTVAVHVILLDAGPSPTLLRPITYSS